MAVTSIRFTKDEEKVLAFLKENLHSDASSIIKKAIYDLYEDIKDREIIEDFENRESRSETKFDSIEDLL